jgi:hypothetical protein
MMQTIISGDMAIDLRIPSFRSVVQNSHHLSMMWPPTQRSLPLLDRPLQSSPKALPTSSHRINIYCAPQLTIPFNITE